MLDPKDRVVSVRALCRHKGDRDQARCDTERAFAQIKRIGPAIPLESPRQLADVCRCKLLRPHLGAWKQTASNPPISVES